MIIEQQQILTTQNLAALLVSLDLVEALHDQLGDMAKLRFGWICKRQQMKIDHRPARLTMVKNTAYAWRQMIFFLALLPQSAVSDFLVWAQEHLNAQSEEFRTRFWPALNGLSLAARGRSIAGESSSEDGARHLLGWSNARHWLLA